MKFGNRTPEDEDAILASGLFDGVWYAARYRDVAWLGMDPFVHFLQFGAAIGRSSGPSFDAARYLRENPDVATAGLNPLLHYLRRGRAEGRLAHPVDRRPVGAPVDFLEAAARRTLQGKPVGRFRNFDLELESEFLDCVEAMVALNPPGWPTGLASVVMPTRNRASLIGRAIESVLAQSHVDWELLVVDDGSSDETSEVLGRFTDDPRIRLFWLDSRGVSAARNVGLAHARGNWIFYLDSDNRWCSGFLRTMLAYLETTGRACGYSGIALEDAQGAVRGYRGEPYDWAACLESNYVDLNSFCHRRSLVDYVPGPWQARHPIGHPRGGRRPSFVLERVHDGWRRTRRHPSHAARGADVRRQETAAATRVPVRGRPAAKALRMGQEVESRPADAAHDSALGHAHQCVAGDAGEGQRKVEQRTAGRSDARVHRFPRERKSRRAHR